MQNKCVGYADLFQSLPKAIPSFCTLHFEFCIRPSGRYTIIYRSIAHNKKDRAEARSFCMLGKEY